MLYEEFMVPCAKAIRTRVSDGEGGWTTAWAEGDGFMAAIVKDSSANVLIAEAQGVTGVYTVVTPKDTPLTFHEAFTRLSDGKSFRIVGVDDSTPSMASFQFCKHRAEEWELA